MIINRINSTFTRDNSLESITIFSSIISLILALVYYLSRLGFENNLISLISVTGIGLFLIGINITVKRFFEYFDISLKKNLLFNHASIILIASIVLCLTGILVSQIKINFGLFFTICGYLFLVVNWFGLLFKQTVKKTVWLIIVTGIFSIWIAGTIWGNSYHQPLFIENMANNNLNKDVLFHAAYSNMIRTYGIPSSGLNGLPYIAYHFGSHWVFAQIGSLLKIDGITFYQMGYPIIFIPLFFYSFLIFILEFRNYCHLSTKLDNKFWLLLMTAFIGFLPLSILSASGIWKEDLFISESYLIAVILSFLFLTVILSIIGKNIERNRILYLITPLFIGLIGIFKVSLMILLFSVNIYLFLKYQLYKKKKYVLSLLVTVILVVLVYKLTNTRVYGENIRFYLFHFIKTYVSDPWKYFYILFNFFWTFIFITLRLYQTGLNFQTIKKNYLKGNLLDIEILLIISIVGLLPGLLIYIQKGSAVYFSDFQRWLAIGLILAYLPVISLFKNKFNTQFLSDLSQPVIIILLFFFLHPFLLSLSDNFISTTKNYVLSNISIRKEIMNYGGDNYYTECLRHGYQPGYFQEVIKKIGCLTKSKKSDLNRNLTYHLIENLLAMNSLPFQERRISLLYIPKTNQSYWQLVKPEAPFIAPALAGIAMINGIPQHLDLSSCFGCEYYQNTLFFNDIPYNDKESLCRKLKGTRFKQIIYLKGVNKEDTRVINCQ